MALSNVSTPYDVFTDAAGRIISSGKVYIGIAGGDPETDPQDVFWDSAGTDPANQPLLIVNGYVVNTGTPAQFFTDADYSIRLYDATNSIVYTYPNILAKSLSGNAGGDLQGTYPNPTIKDDALIARMFADNNVPNAALVVGANNTVKGTLASSIADITAYQLNGILDRVGAEEVFEHANWSTTLYIWANGQTLSRTTDARLFAKVSSLLGTQGALGWGVGDGTTTFVAPDRRGQFMRAYATNNSIDPDGGVRVLGSYQDDMFEAHTHGINAGGAAGAAHFPDTTAGGITYSTNSAGGTETRGKNYSAYVCIVR